MVRITVKLVGALRHAVGVDTLILEFPFEPSLEQVFEEINKRVKDFSKVVEELKRRGIDVIAVADGVGVKPDTRLRDGTILYIMPPTSGGSSLEFDS